MPHHVKIVECPRDAMQGWPTMISTEKKIEYLNQLLQVGFDTLDFGSFVSPKAIPQMADTAAVLSSLDLINTNTKLLAIIANLRGAEQACTFAPIKYLGFPFSVSPTFQMKNTNITIDDAFLLLQDVQKKCVDANKKLVVYLSMGFGNPYGDLYSEELIIDWGQKIADLGVSVISLADTVGVATPAQVASVCSSLKKAVPHVEVGVHLHSTAQNWKEKTMAAYDAGIRRFDGALNGIGGCPMSGSDLVGNMNTRWMLDLFESMNALPAINQEALDKAQQLADEIFL
jgi:hydroxymethylglutaryl-CoA lyase